MSGELVRLLFPWMLILLALVTGTLCERAHFKRIHQREAEFMSMPVLNTKRLPDDADVAGCELVTGEVVISIDYFKRFLASLRNIFGGEVKSYASLLDRGRREAILRMKETCRDADLIINLRVETSSISQGGQKKMGSVEVIAYGTAVRLAGARG